MTGRRLRLSDLERPMWPDDGVTKADVLRWHAAVAPALLPHVAGRPLTLWGWAGGVPGRGLRRMTCEGAPPWLRRGPAAGGACGRVVDDLAGLLWVMDAGALELHPHAVAAGVPSRMVLGIEPRPPAGPLDACRVALRLRDILAVAGLLAWICGTGAAGLRVLVPLAGDPPPAAVAATARWMAEGLAAETPKDVATSRGAAAGRVLVDWRGAVGRPGIAPFGLRAGPRGPTVAAPLRWREVEAAVAGDADAGLRPGPRTVLERLHRDGDPLAGMARAARPLPGLAGGG